MWLRKVLRPRFGFFSSLFCHLSCCFNYFKFQPLRRQAARIAGELLPPFARCLRSCLWKLLPRQEEKKWTAAMQREKKNHNLLRIRKLKSFPFEWKVVGDCVSGRTCSFHVVLRVNKIEELFVCTQWILKSAHQLQLPKQLPFTLHQSIKLSANNQHYSRINPLKENVICASCDFLESFSVRLHLVQALVLLYWLKLLIHLIGHCECCLCWSWKKNHEQRREERKFPFKVSIRRQKTMAEV